MRNHWEQPSPQPPTSTLAGASEYLMQMSSSLTYPTKCSIFQHVSTAVKPVLQIPRKYVRSTLALYPWKVWLWIVRMKICKCLQSSNSGDLHQFTVQYPLTILRTQLLDMSCTLQPDSGIVMARASKGRKREIQKAWKLSMRKFSGLDKSRIDSLPANSKGVLWLNTLWEEWYLRMYVMYMTWIKKYYSILFICFVVIIMIILL